MPCVGRCFAALALAACTTLVAGCLSPGTIAPVAKQNHENIATYTANVATLTKVLHQQAVLQGALQVQIARNAVSRLLIEVRKKSLANDLPTPAALADPGAEPHKSLKADLDQASSMPRNTVEERELIERQFPLVADIALGTRNADIPGVITDAFHVQRLNSRIVNANDPAIAGLLHAQRNRILDQYPPTRRERETIDLALDGLAFVLKEVQSQGVQAGMHANALLVFAEATPQADTIIRAFADQDLRAAVVSTVEGKRGVNAAGRVKTFLAEADNVLSIVNGLRGN